MATAIRGGIIAAKLNLIPVRRGFWGNRSLDGDGGRETMVRVWRLSCETREPDSEWFFGSSGVAWMNHLDGYHGGTTPLMLNEYHMISYEFNCVHVS